MHGGSARLYYSLMRFMVGDLELNLVAMVRDISGKMDLSSVADKDEGAREGYHRENKRGLESVGNEHVERK